MVSLGEGGDERLGVKFILAGGCREKLLVIKYEVGSVEGFREKAQERLLVFGTRIQRGRRQGLKLKE